MVAVVNEQYEIVKILLSAGADPNLGDNFINISRTASEKKVHRLEGQLQTFALYKSYIDSNYSINGS